MIRFAILALLVLAGCACPDHVMLDAKWKPLDRIQAPSVPQAAGLYQTDGSVLYGDPCDFLSRDQISQEGLLVHEQIHARDQLAYVEVGTPGGPVAYHTRYGRDVDFRADAEYRGWRAEIRYVIAHGGTVDQELVATFLWKNYGGVWGLAEAEHWVAAEVAAAQGGAK